METTYTGNPGLLAGLGAGIFIVEIIIYLFFAYCMKMIADKTGHTENSWWAWIPIMQILLLLQIAGKPMWWIVLMLIPFVNIVVYVIVMMEVAKARGKEPFWGILALFGIGTIYLAFSDGNSPATA